MPELAGAVSGAAHELSVERNADADAVGDVHEHDGPFGGRAPHRPELGEHRGLDVVLDNDRQAGRLLQRVAQRHVDPSERGGTQEPTLLRVDESRDGYADPEALADGFLVASAT